MWLFKLLVSIKDNFEIDNMYKEEVRHILPRLSPTELLKFFNYEGLNRAFGGARVKSSEAIKVEPLSLWDYLTTIPHRFVYDPKYLGLYHNTALKIANKLVLEGLLSAVGNKSGIYQQYHGNGYNYEKAFHNCYDFLIYGFPEIIDHFQDAVRVIEIKTMETEEFHVGTGFALLFKHEKPYLVTARHCLPKNAEIRIKIFLGFGEGYASPENVYVPKDDFLDLAILEFSADKLISDKYFRLEHPYLLDNVLVMGYPPVPGTRDAVLVSSTGEVTAKANTYLHKYEQIYVNANIKGGSSGSPIINSFGNVIGIIIESARDISNSGLPDELRFGTGITSTDIHEMLESINSCLEIHKEMPFRVNPNGTFSMT